MSTNVKPSEESTISVQSTGNGPVTNVPLHGENNENEIKNGWETVNVPPPPSNDVECDTYQMYRCQSQTDEGPYYATDSQEI